MAINLDNINEVDVSLEDLTLDSLVHPDENENPCNTFNQLFEDHLAALIDQNGNQIDYRDYEFEDTDIFNIDVGCIDLNEDLNAANFLPVDDIPATDLADDSLENDDCYETEDTTESDQDNKKKHKTIRRQSTRIQNQMRKKIADQIQRENTRIAKEAELLTKSKPKPQKKTLHKKVSDKDSVDLDAGDSEYGDPNITDLDQQQQDEGDEEEDPNKLWCICRQPYGYRFMISCDRCLEWYHGDCVGVTQQRGAVMEANGEEFTCPLCKQQKTSSAEDQYLVKKLISAIPLPVTEPASQEQPSTKKQQQPTVVIIDDDDDEVTETSAVTEEGGVEDDSDDCQIVKTDPARERSNIFQILGKTPQSKMIKLQEMAKPRQHQIVVSSSSGESTPLKMTKDMVDITALSSRTAVCLNPGCGTLVNPKKSLYCSRICLKKYSKIVISTNRKDKIAQYGLVKGLRLAKMTRFVLAQLETETIQDEIAAPTEENLCEFLSKNATFKVFQQCSKKRSNTNGRPEGSKKSMEIMKIDASKRVKVVKSFALLLKKLLPKSVQIEFRIVWQQCVELEESIFKICGKNLNDRYSGRVKEMSELFCRSEEEEETSGNQQLILNFLRQKLSPNYLVTMSMSNKDAKYRAALLIDDNWACGTSVSSTTTPSSTAPPGLGARQQDISSLMRDSTHLHCQHFYDINCKICNKPVVSKTPASVPSSTPNKDKEMDTCSDKESNTEDDNRVSTSVKTPDMAIDMDISDTEEGRRDSTAAFRKTGTGSGAIARKLPPLWEGIISYKEVTMQLQCKAFLVSRLLLGADTADQHQFSSKDDQHLVRQLVNLASNLDDRVVLNGRIKLDVVEEYLRKLRRHSNKEFLIMRLHPSKLDESGRMAYTTLYEHLLAQGRCGVVCAGSKSRPQGRGGLKDCYLYPLNAHARLPQYLLPFNGPGLERRRPHLLLLLVVRSPSQQQHIYKPISPKYDENHEVVVKYGINLEKYAARSQFVTPALPSPIETEDCAAENPQPVSKEPDFSLMEPAASPPVQSDVNSATTGNVNDVVAVVEDPPRLEDNLIYVVPTFPAEIRLDDIPMPTATPVIEQPLMTSTPYKKKRKSRISVPSPLDPLSIALPPGDPPSPKVLQTPVSPNSKLLINCAKSRSSSSSAASSQAASKNHKSASPSHYGVQQSEISIPPPVCADLDLRGVLEAIQSKRSTWDYSHRNSVSPPSQQQQPELVVDEPVYTPVPKRAYTFYEIDDRSSPELCRKRARFFYNPRQPFFPEIDHPPLPEITDYLVPEDVPFPEPLIQEELSEELTIYPHDILTYSSSDMYSFIIPPESPPPQMQSFYDFNGRRCTIFSPSQEPITLNIPANLQTYDYCHQLG